MTQFKPKTKLLVTTLIILAALASQTHSKTAQVSPTMQAAKSPKSGLLDATAAPSSSPAADEGSCKPDEFYMQFKGERECQKCLYDPVTNRGLRGCTHCKDNQGCTSCKSGYYIEKSRIHSFSFCAKESSPIWTQTSIIIIIVVAPVMVVVLLFLASMYCHKDEESNRESKDPHSTINFDEPQNDHDISLSIDADDSLDDEGNERYF